MRGVMTLGHVSILMLLAGLLTGNPFYLSPVRNMITHGIPLAHVTAFFLILLVGLQLNLLASGRFIFAAAGHDPQLNWFGNTRRAAAVVALQIGLACCITAAAVNRLPSAEQIVACAGTAVLLLVASALVARHVGKLRRAYDEWLGLDISVQGAQAMAS